MFEGMSPQKLAIAVIAAIIFALGIYLFVNTGTSVPAATGTADTTLNVGQIPPLTPMMKAVLEKSKGFQALVSYTDRGFEPADVTLQKGEAVRFTNNSRGDLWVAATGTSGPVYPSSGNECGQSAFDSCLSLKPNEFWEFTFDVAGTWSYADNLHKDKTGIIRVQ